jgi:cyclic-di-GMP phosphodiesterase, flagellum assembly factor TipF
LYWVRLIEAWMLRPRDRTCLMRVGAIFVLICMVIVAGAAGATVYLGFGFNGSEATIVALATLAALGLYNFYATRTGIQALVSHQFADLARGDADLARQVAEMERRLAAMEGRVEASLDRTRAVTDPISIEIGALGTLVKQLAKTVTAQQSKPAELAERPIAPIGYLAEAPFTAGVATAPVAPVEADPSSEPAAAAEPTETALAGIRRAINANRVELYLQPIVTLPQRKVRYYEAISRLRTEQGDLLHAADFIAQAESDGSMPRIDNVVAFRCVEVVRRLLLKDRDIGMFCNVSASTLTGHAFPQFLEFLDANRAIAPSLVLEFRQSAVRAMGAMEFESLAALADRGFRFSLDNVVDLRIEPRELANRNFRFVKVPANLLLNRSVAQSDIHPADLSDLVGRFGIDLIADRIESEASVVDLLDCDVRFGQGFLFSPPRPVRAEALRGMPERSGMVAHRTLEPAPAPSSRG